VRQLIWARVTVAPAALDEDPGATFRQRLSAKRREAELIAVDLGGDAAEIDRQVAEYNRLIDEERNVPQLPEVALDVALGH
jgi:hypothetical protein